jgi:hypothetical protein
MKQHTGSVSSSLYEDGHNSRNNILNVYSYKDNMHTSHEYAIIMHNDTFMKNMNVHFYGILCCLCHFM